MEPPTQTVICFTILPLGRTTLARPFHYHGRTARKICSCVSMHSATTGVGNGQVGPLTRTSAYCDHKPHCADTSQGSDAFADSVLPLPPSRLDMAFERASVSPKLICLHDREELDSTHALVCNIIIGASIPATSATSVFALSGKAKTVEPIATINNLPYPHPNRKFGILS